jgi:hypothetical protein
MWLYVYYLSRPRSPDYRTYAADPFDDKIIDAIAAAIGRYADRNGFSDEDRIKFATSFVHRLEYVPDDVSTPHEHYPRYPVETLVHRGGDCEDASVLLAAILHALGYKVGFLLLPRHLQVGVVRDPSFPGAFYEYRGQNYYVLEATGEGWQLGEMPPEYKGESGEVLPLSNIPILFHQWSATATENSRLGGTVHVTNLGNGPASRATGYIEFKPETGGIVGSRIWDLDGIAAGETRGLDFDMNSSGTTRLQGRLQLFVDGDLHDESTCWGPS